MEDNNIKPQKTEQFKKDFTKAVFETIRLWCTKEYEHSKKFKDAYNNWNTAVQDEKDNEIEKYLKDFQNFLSDYSIARNIAKATGEEDSTKNIKEVLNEIYGEISKGKFNKNVVDDIAKKFQDIPLSSNSSKGKPIKPTSLVSKIFFLFYPEECVLYDTRALNGMKKIYKMDIDRYESYYECFINLKRQYEKDGKNIIKQYLDKNKETIKNFFVLFYEAMHLKKYDTNNNSTIMTSPINIMEKDNINFLLHRSLDKYLWYLGDPNKE